jgi:hypothetical protein
MRIVDSISMWTVTRTARTERTAFIKPGLSLSRHAVHADVQTPAGALLPWSETQVQCQVTALTLANTRYLYIPFIRPHVEASVADGPPPAMATA